MHKTISKLAAASVFSCALVLGASTAFADMIALDKATQGGGNKGANYRPVDEFGVPANFYMTARTAIDHTQPFFADAAGSVGTVVIDGGKRDKGAGVQNAAGEGSKGISGASGDEDEELIFWYDQAVTLGSLSIMLRDIDFGSGGGHKDDPVIFLSLAGTGAFGVTVQESEIVSAFTSAGNKRGTVDFGSFGSLAGDTAITAFKIRATNDQFSVTGAATGTPVPEPGALSLLAIGGVAVFKRKFR